MKKNYFLIAVALFFTIPIFAQMGTWTQKGNLPITTNWLSDAAAFQTSTKGYLVTGYDGGNVLNTNWEYDPTTDSWAQKANFPGAARQGAVGFTINGKGYVATGRYGNTHYNTVYEYDPSANTWAQKANFPGPLRSRGVGFTIDSLGYVGTGADINISALSDLWCYSAATNSWTQKQSLPTTRREAMGFSVGGKGYIGSGLSTNQQWYEYDPVANSWTQKANFPNLVASGGWGFSIGNYGYVFFWKNTPPNFYQYNPVTNTWVAKANFPSTGRYYPRGFTFGNIAYMGTGGDQSSGIYYKDWWEYNSGLVSTEENEIDNAISIYPNPSEGKFSIHCQVQNGSAVIYNVSGEKIYSSGITDSTTEIDLSKFGSGVYFIRVTSDEGTVTKKIIKP